MTGITNYVLGCRSHSRSSCWCSCKFFLILVQDGCHLAMIYLSISTWKMKNLVIIPILRVSIIFFSAFVHERETWLIFCYFRHIGYSKTARTFSVWLQILCSINITNKTEKRQNFFKCLCTSDCKSKWERQWEREKEHEYVSIHINTKLIICTSSTHLHESVVDNCKSNINPKATNNW